MEPLTAVERIFVFDKRETPGNQPPQFTQSANRIAKGDRFYYDALPPTAAEGPDASEFVRIVYEQAGFKREGYILSLIHI